jgi:L,D-transpeptidase catalytic domain
MKKATLTLIFFASLGLIAFGLLKTGAKDRKPFVLPRHVSRPSSLLPGQKLKTRAVDAKAYAEKYGFNTAFCFLVDMSLSSGHDRFFVYDLEKDSVLQSGLVTHGRCNQDWLEGRKYGNEPGCGCTSLGKYKIGYPYQGRFGLAFKLYGLDKTNSNAFVRYVVLHSHKCVPESEVNEEICQSDGCPTVAPGFLKKLDPLVRNSNKPVLLWIFE